MAGRGKRSGYKGWVRKSVKDYELYLSKPLGRKMGVAKITQASGGKWIATIQTDIKGLFSTPVSSPPFTHFTEALSWLNIRRKKVSKELFG